MRNTLFIKIIVLFTLLWAVPCWSTTYYIDFNAANDSGAATKGDPWKRSPGMPSFCTGSSGGCDSYSHSAGDVFVFKGGVTWTAASTPLLTVQYSGSPGNVDTYTVDETWYDGGSYSAPIFDAEGNVPNNDSLLYILNKDYIKINGISFKNVTTSGSTISHRAVEFYDSTNGEVSNCDFTETYGGYGISVSTGTMTSDQMVFHNNTFADCATHIAMAGQSGSTLFSNVSIYENDFGDQYSTLIQGIHGDGIHTWGAGNWTDFKIYRNKFHGNHGGRSGDGAMTSHIYFEDLGTMTGSEIYNNEFSYTLDVFTAISQKFEALVMIHGTGTKFYNNTVTGIPGRASDCQNALKFGGTGLIIKNNVLVGCQGNMYVAPASVASATINNNLYYLGDDIVWVGGNRDINWTDWTTTYGFEANGIQGEDPLFVTSTDLQLQSGSPAIGLGETLGSPYDVDLNGDTRSVPWDSGAYEYESIQSIPDDIIQGVEIE